MKKLFILSLIALLSLTARSQLEVQIGANKTELRKNALVVAFTYFKSFDSLYGNQEYFVPGKRSFFVITPQADVRTGTEDAFSSITVKASGLLATFKTTTVAGLLTPDFNKTFHVFPINVGVETNNLFDNINGIFEVGWVPYYQSYGRSSPAWLKKTNIAFFAQAGYKFRRDTTGNSAVGGQIDESSEAPDKAIFRVKGSAGINTDRLVNINGLGIGLVGGADVWYDIANGATYYKIDARGRFFLNDTQFIDFIYQKGSGQPLFNTGDQWGIALTIFF